MSLSPAAARSVGNQSNPENISLLTLSGLILPGQYNDWLTKNVYLTAIATMKASEFLQTFIQYPPSQKPASFSVDQVEKAVHKQIDSMFEKAAEQKKAK